MDKYSQAHAKPLLSAIVAMSENRVIGKDNTLPWHLPADLKHFKEITTGHFIIMGRKTFESIGKPLPNRSNIVLSRDINYQAPGCETVSTIDEALRMAEAAQQNEIFIIGGAEIYRQLLPTIERLYITIVHCNIGGDAWFPELSPTEWQEVSRERREADEKNAFAYSFITLARREK
jgi:dihydrofolate reductase